MGGTGGVWPLCQPRCAVREDVRVAALLRHVAAVAVCAVPGAAGWRRCSKIVLETLEKFLNRTCFQQEDAV